LKLAEDGVKIGVHYYQNESASKGTLEEVRRRGSDRFLECGLMSAGQNKSRICLANLTEAAWERNIGLGVLIHAGRLAGAIDQLVDTLLESVELEAL